MLALSGEEAYSPHMPTVALQAHYDGEKIVLDEPFQIPAHAALIVTVLPAASEPESDTEEAWLRATASSDALLPRTFTPWRTGNLSAMRFRIVLVPFPFDDLSGQKVHPAVCLSLTHCFAY